MANYYRRKLEDRIRSLSLNGYDDIDIADGIFDNIETGNYEILWSKGKVDDYGNRHMCVTGLKKLGDSFKIDCGKYLIDGKALFSSQFINYNISEYRDNKIGEILG